MRGTIRGASQSNHAHIPSDFALCKIKSSLSTSPRSPLITDSAGSTLSLLTPDCRLFPRIRLLSFFFKLETDCRKFMSMRDQRSAVDDCRMERMLCFLSDHGFFRDLFSSSTIVFLHSSRSTPSASTTKRRLSMYVTFLEFLSFSRNSNSFLRHPQIRLASTPQRLHSRLSVLRYAYMIALRFSCSG